MSNLITIRSFCFVLAVSALAGLALLSTPALAQKPPQDPCARTAAVGYDDSPFIPGQPWRVHDISRPHPPLVTPAGPPMPVPPPSDAIVLFDGKDLSQWVQQGKGRGAQSYDPPRWTVADGYTEVVPGTGDIYTKEKFGDIQLHVEWATPPGACGSSQWRGNSGVMLMRRYEIQILDSINNPTYADGQAGAIYGQWPPLVNAARQGGEWQSFDIVFEAPRFHGDKLDKPAFATIFLNGVLVQHRQQLVGPVAHRNWRDWEPHGDEPILLQDHDVPVRFRNIWVRRLKGYDQQ